MFHGTRSQLTIWADASRTLRHPSVALRIQELQQAAAAATIIGKARDVLQAQARRCGR